jgi:hypothetical protein
MKIPPAYEYFVKVKFKIAEFVLHAPDRKKNKQKSKKNNKWKRRQTKNLEFIPILNIDNNVIFYSFCLSINRPKNNETQPPVTQKINKNNHQTLSSLI